MNTTEILQGKKKSLSNSRFSGTGDCGDIRGRESTLNYVNLTVKISPIK